MGRHHLLRESKFFQRLAGHHLSRQLGQGHADGLADKRDRPRGPRIHLQDVNPVVFDRILDVHEPYDVQVRGQELRLTQDLIDDLLLQIDGRDRTGAVAGMDASLLDVLHDAADYDGLAVADCIDVELSRIAEELVDQDRVLLRGLDGLLDTGLQAALVVNDPHRAAAQDKRGANQQGVPQLAGNLQGLFVTGRGPAFRLEQSELRDEPIEPLAVLRQVDAVGRGADDLDARLLQRHRQFQRRLAAELDDDAVGLLRLDDGHHVLKRQRLEVQPVRGVIIRADCLGVTVDHDRFDADLPQRKRGVAAAIVELDALPDPVGPAAEDHDLATGRGVGLALGLVGRVQVRRGGLELCPAGINPLVHRLDAQRLAVFAELGLRDAGNRGHVLIAEAEPLGLLQQRGLGEFALVGQEFCFERNDVFDVVQEPRVDLGQREDFLDGHIPPKRLGDVPQLVPVVLSQPLLQLVR